MTLGLILFTSFLNGVEIRHVYLTWQHNPCHSITINVHGLKTPEELFVYYDTKPQFSKIANYSFQKKVKGVQKPLLKDERRLYHFELSDLEPDVTYYFAIGDRFHAYGNERRFHTIPEKNHSLFFIEGGDWENTPVAIELASQAALLSPHAIWLGGDYPSNVRSLKDFAKWDVWLDVYEKHMIKPDGCMIPMVLAIGNHEVEKGVAPFFFHYFPQGETGKSFFSLPFGKNVHLFVLDSGHYASHNGEQLEWLAQELEKNKEVPVKIALYHVPLFPSVRFAKQDLLFHFLHRLIEKWKSKKMATRLYCAESDKGRDFWMPLFDRYHLTVAFEHHDQALKRTKLLKNEKEDPNGTLYLGDGGWGAKLQYPPIQGLFYRHFAALRNKVHFFWTIEIEDKKITYKAISHTGKVVDEFVTK